MDLNLLEKKELWIENIRLEHANLNDIAKSVSLSLNLPIDKVLVVDVRDNHITLDILTQIVDINSILGKEKEIIDNVSSIKGVITNQKTCIHSAGILGMIAVDKSYERAIVKGAEKMASEIIEKVKKRVIVFPTGFEVKRKLIEDTNSPFIKEQLELNGYKVKIGDVIDDDLDLIAGSLRRAAFDGYGLIITTGGVGAEDKDKTVEAIELLDQEAATPYIVKFEKGTGRHKKDGVRIGVGQIGQTLLVALPGPNDEVKLGIKHLLNGLSHNLSKDEIAMKIAISIQQKLLDKHTFKHTQ